MDMWTCPVCGRRENREGICVECGFDDSRDYEKYPTLAPIPLHTPSIARQRRGPDRTAVTISTPQLWTCPVCGRRNNRDGICGGCGFDDSRDYEKYPTLGPIPAGLKSSEALRRKWDTTKEKTKKLPVFRVIATVLIILIVISGGFYTYTTALACSYVSLDVDESAVEFAVNRRGQVISVQAITDDAEELAEALSDEVYHKSVDDAVTITMERFSEQGVIDGGESEIIASVTADNEDRTTDLTRRVARSVRDGKHDDVPLYLMSASKSERTRALAMSVSPGRYLYSRDVPTPADVYTVDPDHTVISDESVESEEPDSEIPAF